MEKLLIRYCDLFDIDIKQFKGNSRKSPLPTYRHTFYYCLKTNFPQKIMLKHIAAISNKKASVVGYGIKIIENLVTPTTDKINDKHIITSEMQCVKNHADAFFSICDEYEGDKDVRVMISTLLAYYCDFTNISEEDFRGDSLSNRLPTYRRIFYYCIKTKFPSIRLEVIGKIVGKRTSNISRGGRSIRYLITPFVKTNNAKNLVTNEMQSIANHVKIFSDICQTEYKESEIRIAKSIVIPPIHFKKISDSF